MRSLFFFFLVVAGLVAVLAAEGEQQEQVRDKRSWGYYGWPWGSGLYYPGVHVGYGGWYAPAYHGWHY